MFNRLTVRGQRGSLLWGSGDAARLGAWAASRAERGQAWTLDAAVLWSDPYRLKQEPLIFTAPRTSAPRGQWCFPVIPSSVRIESRTLTAQLAQPDR